MTHFILYIYIYSIATSNKTMHSDLPHVIYSCMHVFSYKPIHSYFANIGST